MEQTGKKNRLYAWEVWKLEIYLHVSKKFQYELPLASFRYAPSLGKCFDRLCMHLTETNSRVEYVLIIG